MSCCRCMHEFHICYFDILILVLWIDVVVVRCIAFGRNRCGIYNMVDDLNMVMVLMVLRDHVEFYRECYFIHGSIS